MRSPKSQFKKLLANPFDVDLNKVAAQQARRVLDRWVGYEVSPIIMEKISSGPFGRPRAIGSLTLDM